MEKQNFYFTYGTLEQFPFKGGWTKVRAENLRQAIALFRAVHPDVTLGLINCSSYYTEDYFKSSGMYKYGNLGAFMHEQISLKVILVNDDNEED